MEAIHEYLQHVVMGSQQYQPTYDALVLREQEITDEPFHVYIDNRPQAKSQKSASRMLVTKPSQFINDGRLVVTIKKEVSVEKREGTMTSVEKLKKGTELIALKGASYDVYCIEKKDIQEGAPVAPFVVPNNCIQPRIDTYPVAFRKFTIPLWRMFGLDMKDTIQKFEKDVFNNTSLTRGKPAYATQLAYSIRDFNTTQTEWDFDDFCFVPILTTKVGEMVILTNGPNKAGWCEGYLAKDEDCKLGIIHATFLHLIVN